MAPNLPHSGLTCLYSGSSPTTFRIELEFKRGAYEGEGTFSDQETPNKLTETKASVCACFSLVCALSLSPRKTEKRVKPWIKGKLCEICLGPLV